MPDLTIEIHQMCSDGNRPMRTFGGYIQTADAYHGFHCSCPGFKFRKHCKHEKLFYDDVCSWHSLYSDEPQEREGICPVCGKGTVYVRVGV